MNQNFPRIIILAGLASLLAGCGGGGGSAVVPPTTGRINISVSWPSRGRYLPAYAESMKLTLKAQGTNPDIVKTANRVGSTASSATVDFGVDLSAGNYTVIAEATTQPGGAGSVVANATLTPTVVAGQTTTVPATVETTIATLQIVNTPLYAKVGDAKSLTGRALDALGTTILVPASAYTWTATGPVSVSSAGVVNTGVPGVSVVTLSETGAAKQVQSEIVVNADTSNVGLFGSSAWPKSRGDQFNTGRSQAGVATPTLKWERTFASTDASPVTTSATAGAIGTASGVEEFDRDTGVTLRTLSLPQPVQAPAITGSTGLFFATTLGSVSRNSSGTTLDWTNPLGSVVVIGSPALDGTALYVGGSTSRIFSLNASTGVKNWEFLTSGEVYSAPAVASSGAIVFGSNDRKVYSIDNTGTKLWEFLTGGLVTGAVAIASDTSVIAGSQDGKVYSLSLASGSQNWSFDTGAAITGAPAIGTGDIVYVASGSKLFAISNTGSKLWEFVAGGSIDASPVVTGDGSIYVGAGDGKLYAVKRDGTKLWEYNAGAPVLGSPAVFADGTVIINASGKLIALQ